MLAVYRHMFTIPDLRRKILFTLGVFAIYRLGTTIPVPYADLDAVELVASQGGGAGVLGLMNLFSGGALEAFSVFSLGILPYITASIIMQLLAVVIPHLQRLQEEGASGQKRITELTRIVTVVLAVLQATTFSVLFANGSLTGGIPLIQDYTALKGFIIVSTMTAGTAVIMWLGEQITQKGIGNGMSLIIFVSIVAQLPSQIGQIYLQTAAVSAWGQYITMLGIFLFMVIAIIFVEQGQRRIPIQFAKRVRGRRVMGGNATYIPLKVNTAGVIPVIFATSVLTFPALLVTIIPAQSNSAVIGIRNWVDRNLANQQGGTWTYIIVLFSLVMFFTYFYTAIQFDPVKQADTIQRQGGFIPGVRPGTATEKHLAHILNRITLPGAIFLGAITVLPAIFGVIWSIQIFFSACRCSSWLELHSRP